MAQYIDAGPVPDTYAHIPPEMRRRKQWVAFRTKATGKTKPNGQPKLDKVPIRPFPDADGYHGYASTTDPNTWGSFGEAMAALRKGRVTIRTEAKGDTPAETFNVDLAGIGYVFSEDDPYTFIDLDEVIDTGTGEIAPWAEELVGLLDSLTEVSISHTGLHIFVRGKWGNAWNRRDGLEVYAKGRFCAIGTSHYPGTPLTIEERGDQLAQLHARFMPAKPAAPTAGNPRPSTPLSVDDTTLLTMVRRSKQGPKFERLWQGDIRGYATISEARWALIEILRFWTQNDAQRIERLMGESGFPKDKFEKGRGNERFIEYEIRRRIEGGGPVYEGSQSAPVSLLADISCDTCDDDLGEVIEQVLGGSDGDDDPDPDPNDPAALMAALRKARAERDTERKGRRVEQRRSAVYREQWRNCRQQLATAVGRLELVEAWRTHQDQTLNGDDRWAGLTQCLEAIKNQALIDARRRGADVPEPGKPYAALGAPYNLSEDKLGDAMKVLTREDGGFLVRHERPAFGKPQPLPVDPETGEVREWLKAPATAPHMIAYAVPPEGVTTAGDMAALVREWTPNWEGTRKFKNTERKRIKKSNDLIAQEKAEVAAAELRCPECEVAGTPASVTARLTGFCNHHMSVIADATAIAQEPQQMPPMPVAPNPPPATPDRGIPAHNPVYVSPGIPRRGGRDLHVVSLMGDCGKCGRPQPLAQQPRYCAICTREGGDQGRVVNVYEAKTCPGCAGPMPAHKEICLRCAAGVPVEVGA